MHAQCGLAVAQGDSITGQRSRTQTLRVEGVDVSAVLALLPQPCVADS